MAGLVPAIHASPLCNGTAWMPGTRPGMTLVMPQTHETSPRAHDASR
jgi:hypothetical protein